jgi:hypothetical protein
MTRLHFSLVLFAAANLAACDGGGPSDGGLDASEAPIFTDAGCGAHYASYPPDPGLHTDLDASITWSTNPPSSGTHFPIWAKWGVHTEIVPRGYYVHNEEHGGVVLLYRCIAPDCAQLRQQLETFVNGLPGEPQCASSGVARRVVLTEDPLIDSPVAAAAWGYVYKADCVDEPSLRAFVLARIGRGPEDLCTEGFYP